MSKKWCYFLPGYLWALPHTLFGVLLDLFLYRARGWRWSRGCIECIAGRRADGTSRLQEGVAAQTHGWIIVYSAEDERTTQVRVHERVHVVQAMFGGVFYVALYVGFYFYGRFKWRNVDHGSYWAYRYNPFEVMAYDRQDTEGAWGS